jgi:hypothetical protein
MFAYMHEQRLVWVSAVLLQLVYRDSRHSSMRCLTAREAARARCSITKTLFTHRYPTCHLQQSRGGCHSTLQQSSPVTDNNNYSLSSD